MRQELDRAVAHQQPIARHHAALTGDQRVLQHGAADGAVALLAGIVDFLNPRQMVGIEICRVDAARRAATVTAGRNQFIDTVHAGRVMGLDQPLLIDQRLQRNHVQGIAHE